MRLLLIRCAPGNCHGSRSASHADCYRVTFMVARYSPAPLLACTGTVAFDCCHPGHPIALLLSDSVQRLKDACPGDRLSVIRLANLGDHRRSHRNCDRRERWRVRQDVSHPFGRDRGSARQFRLRRGGPRRRVAYGVETAAKAVPRIQHHAARVDVATQAGAGAAAADNPRFADARSSKSRLRPAFGTSPTSADVSAPSAYRPGCIGDDGLRTAV